MIGLLVVCGRARVSGAMVQVEWHRSAKCDSPTIEVYKKPMKLMLDGGEVVVSASSD